VELEEEKLLGKEILKEKEEILPVGWRRQTYSCLINAGVYLLDFF
jgi:hypothetical protein